MGDEQVGDPELALESLEKVDDLGLDRDVQGAYWFVTDNKIGLDGQRPCDADTLALPAREFVRVAVHECRVEPHHV